MNINSNRILKLVTLFADPPPWQCNFRPLDPHRGGFGTHSILIYGYDAKLGFLIADPTPDRGNVIVSVDHLLAAITAAQVEDDNVIFGVRKKS